MKAIRKSKRRIWNDDTQISMEASFCCGTDSCNTVDSNVCSSSYWYGRECYLNCYSRMPMIYLKPRLIMYLFRKSNCWLFTISTSGPSGVLTYNYSIRICIAKPLSHQTTWSDTVRAQWRDNFSPLHSIFIMICLKHRLKIRMSAIPPIGISLSSYILIRHAFNLTTKPNIFFGLRFIVSRSETVFIVLNKNW